ncbi:MAG: polysaccharide biosynthesis C-terminal domain-containing protein, partial [Acidobacteria bacterium]|nr:polysaccharide biosynthesis C-terminal domain-containing protein [Acidobacteriota bacterium]
PMALRDFSVQPFSAAYPWVSAAAARKERQALQKFLFLAARNILALTLPLAIALFVWAETVLRLWVGEEVLAGTAVFRIFLVFAVFAVLREVPLALVYGIGKIRFSVVSSVAVLLAGIAGGGWACARYGLAGLAIAFAGIQAVATLLLMDHALKVAEIGWPEWLKKAVAPVLLAALATIVWFALWYQFLPRGPASMTASVLLGALVFFGVFVRLVVGPEKLNWHIYARKLLAEID